MSLFSAFHFATYGKSLAGPISSVQITKMIALKAGDVAWSVRGQIELFRRGTHFQQLPRPVLQVVARPNDARGSMARQ